MGKSRLEAFSDGVVAILITIMVLELKVPHSGDAEALGPLVPTFLSYLMSFVFVGIFWNNHHHLLHTVTRASAGILWANLHFLFWLSLVPFATGWMGEQPLAPVPAAAYGIVLLGSAVGYWTLQLAIIRSQGADSLLKRAIGRDLKGKLTFVLYASSIPLSFAEVRVAYAVFVVAALVWLVPDRRVERQLGHH